MVGAEKYKISDLVRISIDSGHFTIYGPKKAYKKLHEEDHGLIVKLQTTRSGNRAYYVVLVDGSLVEINDDYLEKL